MAIEVLLVEDSPGDVRLTQEAFRSFDSKIHLHLAADGAGTMGFLKREGVNARANRPDLIILDLELPKMDERQVLTLIKMDDSLKNIPTIILSTSETKADVLISYQLHANCFLRKPTQRDEFERIVRDINRFWLAKKLHNAKQEIHSKRIAQPSVAAID